MDHWYADCAPCKLAVPHQTEDEAIATAEQHIAIAHPHTSALARADARIGVVQNRTEAALAAPAETIPALPEPAPAIAAESAPSAPTAEAAKPAEES